MASNETGTYREIGTNHQRNARKLLENGKDINIADIFLRNLTQFNEFRVARKQAQINLNSDLPLSNRRDIQTISGDATITKQGPEYRLRATSTADDKATLRTVQRGNYQSGATFEAGTGFRTVGTPTGTAYFKIGYADNGNGIDFLYDADGYHFVVSNEGVQTVIDQADWNLDTLDGSKTTKNPSGISLDTADGKVWQTPFVYYGYGAIVFEIEITGENGTSYINPVHTQNVAGEPAIYKPNLPLRQEVFSGDSGTQLDLYVGGRQFSIWGEADSIERTVGASNTVTGIGADWVPIISFKIKSGLANIPIRLQGLDLDPDDDILYQIQRDVTLTGASFGTPENYVAAECGSEFDTDGTFATQGDLGEAIYTGSISGTRQTPSQSPELPERPLSEFDTYSLVAKGDGVTNVTLKATVRLREDW